MATGLGGVNGCPETDIPDSRKRPLDSEIESSVTKRSHNVSGDGTYHFKILVPSIAAGAIIGKGGETIAQLQKETGARVKMSKANDFYPGTSAFGTTERVCLITGTVESILQVHGFIMEKIREKPDPNAKPAIDFDSKQTAEREKQVKILVPNSTAGMIIGKGGNFIKQIKEESGSYVQISQKSKEHTLSERCITVIGEMENNKRACTMIISKIVEDPQSGSCLNVSYADVQGPVANYNPTGSPFANASQAGSSSAGYSPNGSLGSMSPGMAAAAQMSNYTNHQGALAATMTAMAQSTNAQQFIENFRATLRGSGYSEEITAEITTAMTTLANYGILGLSLGFGAFGTTMTNTTGNATPLGMNMNMNAANIYATTAQAAGASPMDTSGPGLPSNSMYGPIGSVAATAPGGFGSPTGTPRGAGDRYMQTDPPTAAAYDPFRRQSPALGSPVNTTAVPAQAPVTPGTAGTLPINNNSFGLGTGIGGALSKSPGPTDAGGGGTSQDPGRVEVEVGENIVGAILGSGGKTLVEIQHMSGANVQISKKGIFAPGTRNRVVTITGSPNAVGMAQYLIEQRISEEEAKRARQNIISVAR